MHEEYSESKAQEKEKLAEEEEEAGSTTKEDKIDDAMEDADGGHMEERASHFDFRTSRMKSDWYIAYSKVRQGSFLPSTARVRRDEREVQWDKLRKKAGRGRHFAGSWERISGRSIRFLHWLGFDPPNLYPPDEDVTHALAFLAYDRLGRIVEKAIYLRNLERFRNNESKVAKDFRPLWELPKGEQLTKEDIEKSLQDPDVKPGSAYGTQDVDGVSNIQLYFGPGWEERLEIEMEE